MVEGRSWSLTKLDAWWKGGAGVSRSSSGLNCKRRAATPAPENLIPVLDFPFAALHFAFPALHLPFPGLHFAFAALHFAFPALHFAFAALHFAFPGLHFAFAALHFAFPALQFAFAALHLPQNSGF